MTIQVSIGQNFTNNRLIRLFKHHNGISNAAALEVHISIFRIDIKSELNIVYEYPLTPTLISKLNLRSISSFELHFTGTRQKLSFIKYLVGFSSCSR